MAIDEASDKEKTLAIKSFRYLNTQMYKYFFYRHYFVEKIFQVAFYAVRIFIDFPRKMIFFLSLVYISHNYYNYHNYHNYFYLPYVQTNHQSSESPD